MSIQIRVRVAVVILAIGTALASVLFLLPQLSEARPLEQDTILPDEAFPVFDYSRTISPETAEPTILHAADVVVQAGDLYTWTQDTRADWEQGALENLDSVTISGTLQLAQRYFGESTSVTPPADLASGQNYPALALDANGNAYAVWQDGRNGHTDIYFAYRASGSTTWGASLRVNDDAGTAQQSYPAIAVDPSGNAYAIWTDERNGREDIYFAYRPAGGSWGTNVRVNDDDRTAWRLYPAITVDTNGNAYAVWPDSRNGDADIYFAYRPAGGDWGANLRVNDDTSTEWQSYPDIAVDLGGNAYAVWCTFHDDDQWKTYFAYRPAGGNWGSSVRVDDAPPGTARASNPSIAVDINANAYAVWYDYRNDTGDIYFAYRPAGGTWGTNTLIDPNFYPFQFSPDIAVDANGSAYAVWTERHTGNDIYFAYLEAGSPTWSVGVRVNDDSGTVQQGAPAIAVDADGNAHAVWIDYRNGNPDIYHAIRLASGEWSANNRVDDDVCGGTSQNVASIAVDPAGNAYAVWNDMRNGNYDIYFAYRPAGGDWGANVRVNNDTGAAWQWAPDVAVDTSGNAYAVWEDERNGNGDVYFAYRPAGGNWSANIRVNDGGGAAQGSQAIAVDADGNAYAVWGDARNGNGDIYFAYRPAGGDWGANVQVSEDPGAVQQDEPDVAVDASGNACAVWQHDINGIADIYSACRPAGGNWGTSVKVNDDTGDAWQEIPAIALDASGDAYAVWGDDRNGNYDIYFAYRPAGGDWGANVQVSEDPGAVQQGGPDIAVDPSGNAYAIWHGWRNQNADIYFAYRPAGGDWGTNIRVNDDPGTALQHSPAIALDLSDHVYALWVDESYDTGHIHFSRSMAVPEYMMDGIYTSPELDTGVAAAQWTALTYTATVPAGTSLTFETHSRIAGGDWSVWQPANSPVASPPGQYLQYRVTLSTSLTSTTPLLDKVQINYHSVGTPSAPRFVVPCGVTNQTTPTLKGTAAAGTLVHLYVDGSEVATETVVTAGTFTFRAGLSGGNHVLTATAENSVGVSPASRPLMLAVNSSLPYDPVNVRAGQWSKDGWLMSVPRDVNGCANPDNDWRVWPRANEKFRVQVPVSYTTSAAVTVTIGTQTITLTEGTDKTFAGIFQLPIGEGAFIITVTTDGATTIVSGGPVLIDPDGYVYDASKTISDTIAGVQVTCYYSDTHSGQWIVWDAWNYDQVNPQTTLDDGYYSFYTPPATYRVVADKEGCPIYTSPDLVVVSTPVRHNVPFTNVASRPYSIFLPVVLKNQ
jgi:hypothetical protein